MKLTSKVHNGIRLSRLDLGVRISRIALSARAERSAVATWSPASPAGLHLTAWSTGDTRLVHPSSSALDVVAVRDGFVGLCRDGAPHATLVEFGLDGDGEPRRIPVDHRVDRLFASSDGTVLAMGDGETVWVCRTDDLIGEAQLKLHQVSVIDVGSTLWTGHRSGLREVDPATGDTIRQLDVEFPVPPTSIEVHRPTDRILVMLGDKMPVLLDARSGRRSTNPWLDGERRVGPGVIDPDGSFVVLSPGGVTRVVAVETDAFLDGPGGDRSRCVCAAARQRQAVFGFRDGAVHRVEWSGDLDAALASG